MPFDIWLWLDTLAAAKLREDCERFARVSTPLLIFGEPGTGKSLLASAIHRMSRRDGQFVQATAGGLPEHLEQAEFLGYVRGAFTGADRDRKGLIECANGGSFFLDEIGIARPSLQQLCLALTVRSPVIRRLGATRDIPVDVRFIGATNEDLRAAVREGRFRRDFLDRFGWSVIKLPALRDRPEEIQLLVDIFLAAAADKLGIAPPKLAPSLRDHFLKAGWAGNIRHLQDVCGQIALFYSDEQPVTLDHLPAGLCEVSSPFDLPTERQLGIEQIHAVLERHEGNRTRAARELGCSVRTIQRVIKATAGQSRILGNY